MKITIISIGKFENSPHRATFETYLKRLKWTIELKEFEAKNGKNLAPAQLKQVEAELILKAIKPGSITILLDEKGKQYSSIDFAKLLQNYGTNGNSHINFVIGGAFGLDEALKSKANGLISFSAMTFPHLMVRSILIEQLYRAESIINNHPYHKE